MASWWNEGGCLAKTVISLAVAGATGLSLYMGYRKVSYFSVSLTSEPHTCMQDAMRTIHVLVGSQGSAAVPAAMTHVKCRGGKYPRGDNIARWPVADDKVKWTVPYPGYQPLNFTTGSVLSKPVWADPDYMGGELKPDAHWNTLDGKVDRRSHTGPYGIVNGVPRNPVGRTGICGRGSLGRWGPNHAADPIVTRWKRGLGGKIVADSTTGKKIMQFVAIKRRDSGIWAIPGGMVDPGEKVSVTLKREFSEEALNTLQATDQERRQLDASIQDLFSKGIEVYRGYVDDPRNTDNSWMETIAVNFHDETGKSIGRVNLNAGDDAIGVQWTDMNESLNLYASHIDFIQRVATLHNAHW